jgi:pimeloyl-ACP methyl ester carboxylesterase
MAAEHPPKLDPGGDSFDPPRVVVVELLRQQLPFSCDLQTGGTFSWSSDDTSIVAVAAETSSPDGHLAQIVGQKPGTANITATYNVNGSPVASATVTVQDIYPIVLVHGFNSSAVGAWGGPTGLATVLQSANLYQGDSLCNPINQSTGVDFCAVDFCADPSQASGSGPTCKYGPLQQWGSFSDFLNLSASTNLPTEQDEGFWLGIVIGNLLQATGADKVTLLAHSMGGLASRAYLEFYDSRNGQDVDKLVTIGTPNLGTPWASIAADPVFQSAPAAQLVTFLAGIFKNLFIESPAVLDMDPSSKALTKLNQGKLPSQTSYLSMVGLSTAADAATWENEWFQLVDTICGLGGSALCSDLQNRTPTINTFLENSDLVVPAGSENLAIAVPGTIVTQQSIFGVIHAPLPFVSDPIETQQTFYFLQALGLGTNVTIGSNNIRAK